MATIRSFAVKVFTRRIFRPSCSRSKRYCTAAPKRTCNQLYFPEGVGDYVINEVSKFSSNVGVEEAITPPSSWYTHPQFFTLDKAAIFRKHWIPVGRLDQLQEPGQYITGFLADEPYLVTRDESGALQGFYNVCRHHATVLMDECSGKTSQFQCPYHGWTYTLSGRLSRATRLRGIKNFSAKNYGLKPIKVTTWGPLVFINMSPDKNKSSIDFTNKLGEVKNRLDKIGFEDLIFIERRSYNIKCNWKVFIDNYLDGGYHVEYAHKDLASLLDGKAYTTEVFEGFSIQSSSGSTDNNAGQERIGSNVLYSHVYPNLFINRYGPWLDLNYTYPVDAENCIVVFDWFLEKKYLNELEEKQDVGKIAESIRASEQVQAEDITLCERVQKGLRSASYDWGRYAPGVEQADHKFHLELAEDYREFISSSKSTKC